MRKIVIRTFVAIILLSVVGMVSPAQAGDSFLLDLEAFRADLLDDRREVVRLGLGLTPNEETARRLGWKLTEPSDVPVERRWWLTEGERATLKRAGGDDR